MVNPKDALHELRALVATCVEGSAAVARAAELFAALEEPSAKAEISDKQRLLEERERAMFGTTIEQIDQVLARMEPRDIAMYAMGTLSNAQQYIRRDDIGFSVADRHADIVRQLINVAKYAIDKAVPR